MAATADHALATIVRDAAAMRRRNAEQAERLQIALFFALCRACGNGWRALPCPPGTQEEALGYDGPFFAGICLPNGAEVVCRLPLGDWYTGRDLLVTRDPLPLTTLCSAVESATATLLAYAFPEED